jgi:hypothetical protein
VINYIDPILPISARGNLTFKKPAFIHLEMLDRIVPKLNRSLRYDTVVFMCNRVRYRPELLDIKTKIAILDRFFVRKTTY